MIEISKNANPNYLCKIVKLEGLRKHPNADRLQLVDIDFQTVVIGLDAKDGDIYVYFPLECQINADFLSYTNSFRDKTKNSDTGKAGFFEDTCRVRAAKLRGEKSMGYIVPLKEVWEWSLGEKVPGVINDRPLINQEFDTINGKLLIKKYVVKNTQQQGSGKSKAQKRIEKISRIIEGQVHLHSDTENLRKNVHKINTDHIISITYKTHGTSFWVSNVPVKRQLKWYERLLKKIGVNIQDTEYDIVYGSRKVIKNEYFQLPNQQSYYSVDIWGDIRRKIGDKIPKGYTLYGEAIGYLPNSSTYIQKPFDYGCKEGEYRIEIYRITYTNNDGLVSELTYPQIQEFCTRANLTPSHLFYYGSVYDFIGELDWEIYYLDDSTFREFLIKKLEKMYLEKDCFMCNNKVPEEGIVLRVEKLLGFGAYKMKSFAFLEFESKSLDSGEINIEE